MPSDLQYLTEEDIEDVGAYAEYQPYIQFDLISSPSVKSKTSFDVRQLAR